MRLRNHCLKCTHFVEKMYSIFTLIIDEIYIQSVIEEIEGWILIMLQSYIISSVIMISLNEEERILWIQRLREISTVQSAIEHVNVHRIMHASRMHAVEEFSILKHSHQASSRITTTTKSKSDMKTLKKKTWIRWQRETWQSKNQNNRRHQC